MHIILSIFVILIVLLVVYLLWVYNHLARLHINQQNALDLIASDLDKLFLELADDKTWKKQTAPAKHARDTAETIDEKINAWNMLAPYLEEIASIEPYKVLFTKTMHGRRFYNHATKRLNAQLKIFPGNILGQSLGYTHSSLFHLTSTENTGETPFVV